MSAVEIGREGCS